MFPQLEFYCRATLFSSILLALSHMVEWVADFPHGWTCLYIDSVNHRLLPKFVETSIRASEGCITLFIIKYATQRNCSAYDGSR